MIAATIMSGQPVLVPKTPSAARSTARFPRTSFRVHIQAERIFKSPPLNAKSSPKGADIGDGAPEPHEPHRRGTREGPFESMPGCRADHPEARRSPSSRPLAKAAAAR